MNNVLIHAVNHPERPASVTCFRELVSYAMIITSRTTSGEDQALHCVRDHLNHVVRRPELPNAIDAMEALVAAKAQSPCDGYLGSWAREQMASHPAEWSTVTDLLLRTMQTILEISLSQLQVVRDHPQCK